MNDNDESTEQAIVRRRSRWLKPVRIVLILLVAVAVGVWCFGDWEATVELPGTKSIQTVQNGPHATDGGWQPSSGNYVFLKDVNSTRQPLAYRLNSEHWGTINVDHAFCDWQSRPVWFGKSRLLTDANGRSVIYAGGSGGMFLREPTGEMTPLNFGLLDKVQDQTRNERQTLLDIVWNEGQLSLLVRLLSNNGVAGRPLTSSLRHLQFELPSDGTIDEDIQLVPILDQSIADPAFHGRLSPDGTHVEYHQTTPAVLPSPGPPRFVSYNHGRITPIILTDMKPNGLVVSSMFLDFVGRPTAQRLMYLRQNPKTRSAELLDMKVVTQGKSQRPVLKPFRPPLDLGVIGSRIGEVEVSRDGRYALTRRQSFHSDPISIISGVFGSTRNFKVMNEVAVVDLKQWRVVGSIRVTVPQDESGSHAWTRIWFGQNEGEVVFSCSSQLTTTDFREWGIAK